MRLRLDRTLTVTTYLLLLLVAVASCLRYPLDDPLEPPDPPEPELDKWVWYVQSQGSDENEGHIWALPLQTVQTALDRIVTEVDNGWPEKTEAEIVIMDAVFESVEIKKEDGRPDYPRIRLRGPNPQLDDGLGGAGTLQPNEEQYVLSIENNLNEVLLGENLTLTGGRGGVYVAGTGKEAGEEAKFTIETNATIAENEAADGSGGGVYVGPYGRVTMKGGLINNNTASSSGGGVYVASYGTFKMTGGTISNNTAFFGGGVAVGAGGSLEAEFIMEGATAIVTNNTAIFAGGGVYVGAGSGVIFDKTNGGTISSNTTATIPQNYGRTVAVGSTDINSINQIEKFRDDASPATNKLYAGYIFNKDSPTTSQWWYNGTETNWR